MAEDIRKTSKMEGMVKVTIEIAPSAKDSRVKEFRRVMEFPVAYEDLPLRLAAESARKEMQNVVLSEEMCED
jgi:hypothetical protein